MSKPLDKMTKSELLGHIKQLDTEIALLRDVVARTKAPKTPSLGDWSKRYCAAHGVKSVDRVALINWMKTQPVV